MDTSDGIDGLGGIAAQVRLDAGDGIHHILLFLGNTGFAASGACLIINRMSK